MWLDRFAGHHPAQAQPPPTSAPSVSASQPRSQSPLPRRTSSVRAPYFTSQTRPSLSRHPSTDSTTSLLASSKRANGSGLRQSTIVDEVPDPEEVLARILGPPPAEASITETAETGDDDAGRIAITDDDLNLEFDFGGLSLRELARSASAAGAGDIYRLQTVEDCTSLPWAFSISSCTHSMTNHSRTRQGQVRRVTPVYSGV